jgi:hypothetical protein
MVDRLICFGAIELAELVISFRSLSILRAKTASHEYQHIKQRTGPFFRLVPMNERLLNME